MALDYIATIELDSQRLLAALGANRDGAIPWCGDWMVKDCALHVGAVHHVVAQVVAGRPTANFGLFESLERPDAAEPALDAWVADGTAAVLRELGATDPNEAAWSWSPAHATVGFWQRRMAQETLVHRWDAERGAGIDPVPADPAFAADGVDEFLEVFAPITRAMRSAPGAGETAHLHCTDADGEWTITLPAAGAYELRREHTKGDVALRGPAESLLLFLWGRYESGSHGIEVHGESSIATRWRELMPAM